MFGRKLEKWLSVVIVLAVIAGSMAGYEPEQAVASTVGFMAVTKLSYGSDYTINCTDMYREQNVTYCDVIYFNGTLTVSSSAVGFNITGVDMDDNPVVFTAGAAGYAIPEACNDCYAFLSADGYIDTPVMFTRYTGEPQMRFYRTSDADDEIEVSSSAEIVIDSSKERLVVEIGDEAGIKGSSGGTVYSKYREKSNEGAFGSYQSLDSLISPDGRTAVLITDTVPGQKKVYEFTVYNKLGISTTKTITIYDVGTPEILNRYILSDNEGNFSANASVSVDFRGNKTETGEYTLAVNKGSSDGSVNVLSGITSSTPSDSQYRVINFAFDTTRIDLSSLTHEDVYVSVNSTPAVIIPEGVAKYPSCSTPVKLDFKKKLNISDSTVADMINKEYLTLDEETYTESIYIDNSLNRNYMLNNARNYISLNSGGPSGITNAAIELEISSDSQSFRPVKPSCAGRYYIWYRIVAGDSANSPDYATEWYYAFEYDIEYKWNLYMYCVDSQLISSEDGDGNLTLSAMHNKTYSIYDSKGFYTMEFGSSGSFGNAIEITANFGAANQLNGNMKLKSNFTGKEYSRSVSLVKFTSQPGFTTTITPAQNSVATEVTPDMKGTLYEAVFNRSEFDACAGVSASLSEAERNQARLMYLGSEDSQSNESVAGALVKLNVALYQNEDNEYQVTFDGLTANTEYILFVGYLSHFNTVKLEFAEFRTLADSSGSYYGGYINYEPEVTSTPEEVKEDKKDDKKEDKQLTSEEQEEKRKKEQVEQVIDSVAKNMDVVHVDKALSDLKKGAKNEKGQFVKEDGKIANNEFVVKDNGKMVFVGENGKKVVNTLVDASDEVFFCQKNGVVAQDKIVKLPTGDKMIATESGALILDSNKRVDFDGKVYVTKENGVLASKEFVAHENGKISYADKNGEMKVGKFTVDGTEIKTNSYGSVKRKYIEVEGDQITVKKK